MNHWDIRFLTLAAHVGSWSKDPNTKVGSVIVDNLRRPIGTGFNGFPRGVRDLSERYEDKETKYKLIVHAEANAILNAIVSVRGASIYTTKHICSECAKLVVQSGIARAIMPPADGVKWLEDAKFAMTILSEGGVQVLIHE